MTKNNLSPELLEFYNKTKHLILNRLEDFTHIPSENYFYEFCYCICTPQSKARNALIIQNVLQEADFYKTPFDTTELLRQKENYVRFHNVKSARLLESRSYFKNILDLILNFKQKHSEDSFILRDEIVNQVNGFGMKESSHFLRNIGFRNLAILDRHILHHLEQLEVIPLGTKITNNKKYREIENLFKEYSEEIQIPMDELDLLFWSFQTGEILK